MDKQDIFYDLEVFPHLNLGGFLLPQGVVVWFVNSDDVIDPKQIVLQPKQYLFINDRDRSKLMLDRLNHGTYRVYGFNNHSYDDFIITDILNGKSTDDVYFKNNLYISKSYKVKDWPEFDSYDLREGAQGLSLKKFEAMAGLSVEETTVPFNKRTTWQPEELQEVLHYNLQDLKATKKLLSIRNDDAHGEYFTNKMKLVSHFGTAHAYRYSNTTIASIYLTDGFKMDNLKPAPTPKVGIPDEAVTFLNHAEKASPAITRAPDVEKPALRKRLAPLNLKTQAFNNLITWGFGGMHSAIGYQTDGPTGKKHDHFTPLVVEDVYQLDVSSMFPSIIIRDQLLGPATGKYQQLVKERLINKRQGSPFAKTQKIIINSTYGGMRAPWLDLYNPDAAIHVNVSGMVAVYNLARGLAPFSDIIQINTDGIAVHLKDPNDKQKMLKIKRLWESYFKLNLEVTHFTKLYQKDVNNYVAIKDNGHLKLKGGQVSQAVTADPLRATSPRVIQALLLQKITHPDTDLDVYLKDHLKDFTMQDFCSVLSARETDTQTGFLVDADGHRLPQKVNRAYASNNGRSIYKEKTSGKPAKLGGVSSSLSLLNSDISEADLMPDIDFTWYIDQVTKQYSKWIPQLTIK